MFKTADCLSTPRPQKLAPHFIIREQSCDRLKGFAFIINLSYYKYVHVVPSFLLNESAGIFSFYMAGNQK